MAVIVVVLVASRLAVQWLLPVEHWSLQGPTEVIVCVLDPCCVGRRVIVTLFVVCFGRVAWESRGLWSCPVPLARPAALTEQRQAPLTLSS